MQDRDTGTRSLKAGKPFGIANSKSQIADMRSEICYSERSEDRVLEAQTHFRQRRISLRPRLEPEGFSPRRHTFRTTVFVKRSVRCRPVSDESGPWLGRCEVNLDRFDSF